MIAGLKEPRQIGAEVYAKHQDETMSADMIAELIAEGIERDRKQRKNSVIAEKVWTEADLERQWRKKYGVEHGDFSEERVRAILASAEAQLNLDTLEDPSAEELLAIEFAIDDALEQSLAEEE